MNNTQANFILVVGFLLVLGGVGGIEHSVDNDGLVAAMLIATLGLAMAWCGVRAHKILGNM